MGYKYGVVEWGLPPMGPAGLEILSKIGLQGLELDFGEYEQGCQLSNPRIQDLYLECGAKYGMEFPSMALNALNVHGMSAGRGTLDGMIAMEVIKKGIDAAKRMNIPVVQLPSFHDNRGDIRTEQDFYNTCEMLRYACDISSDTNLILALENVMDAEKTLEMIEKVGCDRLKVMFDTQNYYLNHGYDEAELLRAISRHVVQIHVKDGFNNTISSATLGTGDVSLDKTVEAIKETQCTEWLLIENFYNAQPMNLWRDDMFDLLEEDLRILKGMFAA